jgi:hypothetical protein
MRRGLTKSAKLEGGGEKLQVDKKYVDFLVHKFFGKKHVELSSFCFELTNLFMNAAPNIDMLSIDIKIKKQPFTVIWLRFWGSVSLFM